MYTFALFASRVEAIMSPIPDAPPEIIGFRQPRVEVRKGKKGERTCDDCDDSCEIKEILAT